MRKQTNIITAVLTVILIVVSPIETVNAQLTREDPFAHLATKKHTDPLTKAIHTDLEATRHMATSIKEGLYFSANKFKRYEKGEQNPKFTQKAIKDILKFADSMDWREAVYKNKILNIAPKLITNISVEDSSVKNGIYTWTATMDVSFLLHGAEGQSKDSKTFKVIMHRSNEAHFHNFIAIDSFELIE
ncbi:MAG: hypothetical protein ACRBB3_05065 [Alphaproteobacteria bacterium]